MCPPDELARENSPALGDRYQIFDRLASGGMGSVHFGRLKGPAGFSRIVAIKCLHPHLARNPEFVSMMVDEARLAARIQHPNVVQTLDMIVREGELNIVLEYVQGLSLAKLLRLAEAKNLPPSTPVACRILCDVLQGLQAAHEALDEKGQPLSIVHRDVSPQNILVGADGVARLLDFGVAYAVSRVQITREGELKGKPAYMAPEQIRTGQITLLVDVYAAGVVLWELLSGRRLLSDAIAINEVLYDDVPLPGAPGRPVGRELSAVVLRALRRRPEDRFASAREMFLALNESGPVATPVAVAQWVESVAHDALQQQREQRLVLEGAVDAAQATSPDSYVESDPSSLPTRPEEEEREPSLRQPTESPETSAPLAIRESRGQRVGGGWWGTGRWIVLGALLTATVAYVLVRSAGEARSTSFSAASSRQVPPESLGSAPPRGSTDLAPSAPVSSPKEAAPGASTLKMPRTGPSTGANPKTRSGDNLEQLLDTRK